MNADTFSLAAEKRSTARPERKLLEKEGRVLGVVYGYKIDPVPISLGSSELLKVYRRAGQSALINLQLDGKTIKVIVKDLRVHPVRQEIQHVDFFAVSMTEKTYVTVPLEFVGESPAIRDDEGVFVAEHRELELRCLPSDIPSKFEVDLSAMENIGDSITVDSLKLNPEKYDLVSVEPDSTLCLVVAPREEEPEEVPEEDVEPELVDGESSEEGEEGKEGGDEKKDTESSDDKKDEDKKE